MIESIQLKYITMLQRYLKEKYPRQAHSKLAGGLMLLQHAKELYKMHSQRLPFWTLKCLADLIIRQTMHDVVGSQEKKLDKNKAYVEKRVFSQKICLISNVFNREVNDR